MHLNPKQKETFIFSCVVTSKSKGNVDDWVIQIYHLHVVFILDILEVSYFEAAQCCQSC